MRAQLWPHCSAERHALEIEQLVASPGLVAVAESGGALVGFAEVSLRHDHVEGTRSVPVPYLEGWFVAATMRGKGVGRSLIAFVEDWARSEGFAELASDAELDNTDSIKAHGALGFREISRTVHFVKTLGERLS